ncbi:MAG: hypothetical protein WCO26_18965 [Deltaproteobacteria bacterium]
MKTESRRLTAINSLIIMQTCLNKIPPDLPFPKGGDYPSLAKRGEGRFYKACPFNFETLNELSFIQEGGDGEDHC